MTKIYAFYNKLSCFIKLFKKVGYNSRIELKKNQINVGDRSWLGQRCYLGCYSTNAFINIGSRVYSGDNLQITSIENVSINDNVLIGRNVTIVDHNHGDRSTYNMDIHPSDRPLISKGPIIIGKNVWIGSNVVILGGVEIGNNAVISANSVVRKNVKSFEIYK